jgi:hypothetical protein
MRSGPEADSHTLKVGGKLAVVQLLLELVELCNVLLHCCCFLCSTLSLSLAFSISLFEPVDHSICNQESLFRTELRTF